MVGVAIVRMDAYCTYCPFFCFFFLLFLHIFLFVFVRVMFGERRRVEMELGNGINVFLLLK
jgi:hypothetical protein